MTSWDPESDRRLLFAILAGSDIITPKWDNINMAGRTTEALRQRFKKLRKMVADEADAASAAPQTPAPKRGRGRPATKRKADDTEQDDDAEKPASAKRGRKAKTTTDDDDEDAAEELELPKPTRATRANSVKTAIKTEEKAETGADAAENEADEYVDSSWLRSEFEYPSSDPLPQE